MLNEKSKPEFLSMFSAEYWRRSVLEVKNVRTLAVCALLIAARVVLKSVKIPVGDSLNIFVGFLFNAVSGAVCGPVLSFVSGVICDLLGWVIAPSGPFMPVFTLIEAFCAVCYSLCLYSTKISAGRIALSKVLVNVFGNIVFTSFAMNLYYGKGIVYYLLPRIVKNILMLPVEVMLLVLLFNALTPVLVKVRLVPAPQQKMTFNPVRFSVVLAASAVVFFLTWIYFGELKSFFSSLIGL